MRISDWSSDVCSSDFCVGLVVLPTRNGGRPRLIDISHDLIMDRPAWYGWSAFPIGTPAKITPRWLQGGGRITYLKRADGVTRVWLGTEGGSGSQEVSQSLIDDDTLRTSLCGREYDYVARTAS